MPTIFVLAYQLWVICKAYSASEYKALPNQSGHELSSAKTCGTQPDLIVDYVGHWTFAPMPKSEQQGLKQGFYAISTSFALFIKIEEDHPPAMQQMDCKCEVSSGLFHR